MDWIHSHEQFVWWLAIASLATFVLTLILVPLILIRLPSDYFSYSRRRDARVRLETPALRLIFVIVKNIVGAAFVALGAVLIMLPGQGLLTMLVGIMMLDFPGKYRFERWLVQSTAVRRAINWIRRRAGKVPLEFGAPSDQ